MPAAAPEAVLACGRLGAVAAPLAQTWQRLAGNRSGRAARPGPGRHLPQGPAGGGECALAAAQSGAGTALARIGALASQPGQPRPGALVAAMRQAVLSLRQLSKAFGAVPVAVAIDLEIEAGEVHAIIGPNGAGKTSLINQISGALSPDGGRIIFAGRDVTDLSVAARARLGFGRSFQITQILPRFTALENVAIAAQARAGSSFRFWRPAGDEAALTRAAAEALDGVALTGRANTRAGVLPHGDKRRLEIAIALAHDPKLLLLDEPMAGAGGEDAERLIATLKDLKGRYTMLLVEHDMQAVFALADRISVLVAGRLIATGSPQAVRADPAVRAAYLGEAA